MKQKVPELLGFGKPEIYTSFGAKYAILFSGLSSVRHVNDLEFVYRILIDRCDFKPRDIKVLNYSGNLECTFDDDWGTIGTSLEGKLWPGDSTRYRLKVNGPGGRADLIEAIKSVGRRVEKDDLLLVFSTNHGLGPEAPSSTDPCYLCAYPPEDKVSDEEFGAALRGTNPLAGLVVMMAQCNSGGFLNSVLSNSRASKTVFMSAAPNSAHSFPSADGDFDEMAKCWAAGISLRMPDGAAVSSGLPILLSQLKSRRSVRDIYNWARNVDRVGDRPQYADLPVDCGLSIRLVSEGTPVA